MKNNSGWVCVCAVLLLAGCGDSPPEEAAPAPVVPRPVPPTEAQKEATRLTANMVAGVKNDESPAAVQVKFDLLSRPKTGELLVVRLVFIPQEAAAALSATFAAADGLTIPGSQPPAEFTQVEAGAAYSYDLKVVPDKNGVHYLSAVVQLQGEGEPRIQTFSVPVVVGPPPP